MKEVKKVTIYKPRSVGFSSTIVHPSGKLRSMKLPKWMEKLKSIKK